MWHDVAAYAVWVERIPMPTLEEGVNELAPVPSVVAPVIVVTAMAAEADANTTSIRIELNMVFFMN
jgi:hypothetical protein